jgi:hypothetical protein
MPAPTDKTPPAEPATVSFPTVPAQRSPEERPPLAEPATYPVAPAAQVPATPKRSRRRLWVTLATVAAALLLIGVIAGVTSGQTPAASGSGSTTWTPALAAPTTANRPAPTTTPGPAAVDPLAPTPPAVYTGTGSDVVSMRSPVSDLAVVRFECPKCKGNVVLKTDTGDLLVNEIGSYTGQTLVNERGSEAISRMQVTASGSWTLTVGGLWMAQIHNAATEAASGTGDDVVVYRSSPDTARLTHGGKSNFAVWGHGTSGSDLLVNEIGAYQGTVMLPTSAGSALIMKVTADGKWTMTPQ